MSQQGTPKIRKLEGISSHRSSVDGGLSTRLPSIRTTRPEQVDFSTDLRSESTPRLLDNNIKPKKLAMLAFDPKVFSNALTPKSEALKNQLATNAFHKPSETPSETISKNEKVGRIVKQTMRKMKFLAESQTDKFESKFKIFKGVSTFINVKETMQNLNVLNQIEQGDDQEAAERAVKKRLLEASKSENAANIRMNSRFSDPSLGQFDAVLNQAKKIVSNSVNNKKMMAASRELHHRAMSLVDNVLISDRGGNGRNRDADENNDLDLFYDKLEKDFLTGRYEKPDYVVDVESNEMNAMASKMDYLRMMLEEKTKLSIVKDKNYHANFKQRAEKVITVLKKTAKKIFDRKENPRIPIKADTERPKQMSEEDKIKKEEQRRQKTEVLAFLENRMNGFSNINTLPVEKQLELLKSRANNLSNFDPTSIIQTPVLTKITRRRRDISNPLLMRPEVKNREINALHKKYAEVLINDLGNQEKNLHQMKEVMNKQIEQLEGMYQLELEKMTEKPNEAIRINFETKEHLGSFGSKKIGGHVSAKMLAKVLGN